MEDDDGSWGSFVTRPLICRFPAKEVQACWDEWARTDCTIGKNFGPIIIQLARHNVITLPKQVAFIIVATIYFILVCKGHLYLFE